MKKLIVFDYDNTLAEPVSVPSVEVLSELGRLLEENYLAVISGGRTLEQMEKLLVKHIPVKNELSLRNLFLGPSYGNKLYNWSAEGPILVHETEPMVQEDKKTISEALRGLEGLEHGESKEKDGYITFSCLGNEVSNEKRKEWDLDGSKRLPIRERLNETLGEKFNLFIAGRASIDIVSKGRNKADNVVRLAKMLDIPLTDVIYTGDEFQVYGNDYPLLSLKDVKVNIVKNPEETLEVIQGL